MQPPRSSGGTLALRGGEQSLRTTNDEDCKFRWAHTRGGTDERWGRHVLRIVLRNLTCEKLLVVCS